MRRNEPMHPCPRPLSALVRVTLRLQWLGKLAKTFMIFIFIRLIELAVERERGRVGRGTDWLLYYYEDRAQGTWHIQNKSQIISSNCQYEES